METTLIFVEPIQDIIVSQILHFQICRQNFMLAYLDLSQTSTDEATLTFTLGDATLNQWKIKVLAKQKDFILVMLFPLGNTAKLL